jgi:hypothetical protein
MPVTLTESVPAASDAAALSVEKGISYSKVPARGVSERVARTVAVKLRRRPLAVGTSDPEAVEAIE